MSKNGFFITFEGIDGCGKTTQLKLAVKFLKSNGLNPIILREPGSTPLSEKVRKILLDKRLEINPLSELMLYEAARAELVQQIISPALKKRKTVLCDRFYDSTTAYQGYGRGIDVELIKKLNNQAVGKCHPDLTFIIDVDYKTSLHRRKKNIDRLESESRAFFNKVRKGFLDIARANKKRIVVVDGRNAIDDIFQEVKSCLIRRMKI